jgi:4-hydroxythreonine-4-phosphate dehydrogenase
MSSHVFISPGDPAGIGPEITLKSLKNLNETHKFVIAGDIQYFENLSASLKLGFEFIPYGGSKTTSNSKLIEVINIPLQEKPVLGSSSVNILVTGPVNKETISSSGTDFSGHTEFLAEHAKIVSPLMLMANEKIKIGLATTHVPIKKVSESITEDLIYNKLKVLCLGLKRLLKKENLKICVLGLNPHAGEGGYIGTEESTTILKGIKKFDQREVAVDGPISADTAFSEKNLSHYDAFLAMFHDQGMIPAKILGFGQTLNITFGLPYLRISVDHGTALDIADDMNADFSSMKLALETALASLDEKK